MIERELLLAEGERYDEARAEESMRNLRALGIFALVRIVAVTTPDPNAVGLLVYTRDLWSLRLETGFAGTGKAFQLTAQVSERNFLGRTSCSPRASTWIRTLSAWVKSTSIRAWPAASSRCASRST